MIEKIVKAGKQLLTIEIDYTEKDGSNEGYREIEPYSFRTKSGVDYFFGYDILKGGIRQFIIESINDIKITNNSYEPRWPVEF